VPGADVLLGRGNGILILTKLAFLQGGKRNEERTEMGENARIVQGRDVSLSFVLFFIPSYSMCVAS
jgi:hypothetical protein